MRLCIVSLKKFCLQNGRYWTYGGFGDYVSSFLPYFDEIVLCVPVSREPLPGMYPLSDDRIRVTELPYYRNELQLLLKWPAILVAMRKAVKRSSVINPRIPDMTGVAGWLWARWYRKPHFVSVQSDMRAFLNAPNNTRTRGLVRVGLYAWIRLYLVFEKHIVRRSLSFPQGHLLASRFAGCEHAHEWMSSSVRKADFDQLPNRDYSSPRLRLLHVGRVTRAKGHIYLLRALRLLSERFPALSFSLECVGKSEEALLEALLTDATDLGIAHQIEWTGNVERKALRRYYDDAHFFIFPSIWEGTPKVLLEAMARRLPVVAADVGGIGGVIKDRETGMLVPPQDPERIYAAVVSLLENPELRQRCVTNAEAFAREHTVESQTRFIIERLRSYYPSLMNRFRRLQYDS